METLKEKAQKQLEEKLEEERIKLLTFFLRENKRAEEYIKKNNEKIEMIEKGENLEEITKEIQRNGIYSF